jgi:putative membrane protein
MTTTPAAAADSGTLLAVERTRLAQERTMMAWVRTGTSMISFGFTVYKFFDLQPFEHGAAVRVLIGPREFAMIMIGTGVISLLLATIEHRRGMKILAAQYGRQRFSVAGVVAWIVSIMGLSAFLAAMFHG